MRLPRTLSSRSALRFNITPMIDVVFLLIVFFLVASYFLRSEQSQAVQLPTAVGGRDDSSAAPTHLTITVESSGRWSIAGRPLEPDQVESRIHELAAAAGRSGQVRIRADRNAAYREIRRLIEMCAAHQLRGIQFAVSTGSVDGQASADR